jgi:hypothetical protein
MNTHGSSGWLHGTGLVGKWDMAARRRARAGRAVPNQHSRVFHQVKPSNGGCQHSAAAAIC